ncbi:OLC1v1036855C1 [Oldenlandia corymbosa var. corymbosa]|uniref:RING-type E3 ubiquitin transferase n=1 Tax=Oldenlandia corymbosa var. corymbosa TaxID=529605 RepID=A0AAV1CWX7_OLDCO|nr:OLC1v1036855C1 [Oldenlandia corymbosa var. corymbosa]
MDLPCDGDGLCMSCKEKPPAEDTLTCKICVTPWHVTCLSQKRRPKTMSDVAQWDCPDCVVDDVAGAGGGDASVSAVAAAAASGSQQSELLAAIRRIENDDSLSADEKARRRQQLVDGRAAGGKSEDNVEEKDCSRKNDVLDLLDKKLYCSICMLLPDRPVTTPCGHNFCLKCFQKWVAQGKNTCANCRNLIPSKMAKEPRINSALVFAIRTAKMMNSNASGGPPKPVHFIHNQNRPDKAFVTERAKKSGKANACSGKIFVTIPHDHFGPILPENDPQRNLGVMVGETWEDRMECRQWGAHFPHVAGIAGQSDYGAQSVALSGGYEDDEDHGEWFLYTGSGGRDLSGNKRTNKLQSFDQKFDKMNEALRVSCLRGYPVRVVRSHKEKRSSYAPEKGVRYDGVYRIEKCWRKGGKQGFKMCRYLFVRCDNDPAPWTSDTQGDRPRPLPAIPELKEASDITTRKGSPSWDYDEEKGCWMWKKAPPESRIHVDECDDEGTKIRKVRHKKNLSVKEKLLKEFGCLICRKVMVSPVSTPCGHNFCKGCLQGAFEGQSSVRERNCEGRRTLRAQKNIMKCPHCKNDISDFLQDPQVNRELMNVIESLQRKIEEENAESAEGADDSAKGPKEESSDKANVTDSKPELDEDASEDDEEASEDEEVSEDTDKENVDMNSGVIEVKDKTEAILPSLDSGKTTDMTKPKMSIPDEVKTASVVDEGKQKTSKRKTAADSVLTTNVDGAVRTRSKKAKGGAGL